MIVRHRTRWAVTEAQTRGGVLSGEALVAMARRRDAEDARERDHVTRTRGM